MIPEAERFPRPVSVDRLAVTVRAADVYASHDGVELVTNGVAVFIDAKLIPSITHEFHEATKEAS